VASDAERQEPLSPVKQALLEVRRLRARLEAAERSATEPVAIVGIGCRFPGGARDPEAFWQLLRDGVDAVGEIPRERWDVDAYFDADPDAAGRMYVRHGAFLTEVDRFDAAFFGISPREARSMDPQQRLLLEVAWEALEHGGQAPDRLAGTATGVFVGIGTNDYAHLQARAGAIDQVDPYFATGTAHSVAAGRLSYVLGLRGPSVAVDTACSSSLVAVHLACHSLRLGECRVALAAGCNLILWPDLTVNFCRARLLSPAGRCRTFDAAADGYVRGEGVGAVVLKRLTDALADGDRVLAVIRGSAVNQDGRTSGLTVPNGPSQEALIRQALAAARMEPGRVSYVETHGTGTALGDPIETRALGAALGGLRPDGSRIAIGSVKTNIGHLEAAAGIAGLIKVVLALQHAELPAHLHLTTPSPHIAWNELPLEVVTERRRWVEPRGPRVAGVSSFGFSGTNAHVILEEAPPAAAPEVGERPAYVLPLSARSPVALRELAARFARHLTEAPGPRLADVCFTAGVGRSHLGHRAAVVAAGADEIAGRLRALAAGAEAEDVFTGSARAVDTPRVAFLFTGQGPQHPGMGARLYALEPAFREAFDACAAALDPHLEPPLHTIVAAGAEASVELDEARHAQPAMFAIEYALAAMWRVWGVEPAAVIGHSLGEYAAACVAGVLSLDDAARLVALRGRVMDALPPGAMAAVWASEADVVPRLTPHGGRLAIAAINAPGQVVISGSVEAVRTVGADLEREGVRVRPLTMTHAFHSPMVEPALAPLVAEAAGLEHREPRIAMVSNVSGRLVGPGELTAAYWGRHARMPVRFAEGLAALRAEGIDVFLEVGPHPALIPLGPQCVAEEATWLATLRRGEDDWTCVLQTLGALYARGVDVDWSAIERGRPRRRVALPTHPFQRVRHWIDAAPARPTGHVVPPGEAWARALAAGRRQAEQGPLDLAAASYPARWAVLGRLSEAYMAAALVELGCFTRAGERHTAAGLAARWDLPPARRHLLARWLARLADAGLLAREGDELVSLAALTAAPLAQRRAEARAALADTAPLLDYVERCGARLAAVLAGGESPLETLFPGGSVETAEYLYQAWPVIRYVNGLARAVVEAWIAAQPADLALRAIEIGAGTGGTTSALLPALPASRTVYHYTDVSTFFFGHAARKFAAYPFLRTGLLDLERAPAEQGWSAGSYHLVVAANVLHATQDLDRTLAHVRSLLAPGGLLVVCEGTEHLPWFDVTTGLIEGWQRFDDQWRVDHPLLTPARWTEALRAHGFEAVAAFPEPGSPATALAHHVIVAMVPADPGAVGAGAAPEDAALAPAVAGLEDGGTLAGSSAVQELRDRLAGLPAGDRLETLVGYVREAVARVLRLDAPEELDRRHRLMELGVDSLMALELRKRLGAGLGLARPLPATLIFDHPSIEAVARLLARELEPAPPRGERPAVSAAAPAAAPSRLAVEDVERLADADVEALLLKRLEHLR
jgi:acyl transferase domain-containing protein